MLKHILNVKHNISKFQYNHFHFYIFHISLCPEAIILLYGHKWCRRNFMIFFYLANHKQFSIYYLVFIITILNSYIIFHLVNGHSIVY